jgi:hypothetical protein
VIVVFAAMLAQSDVAEATETARRVAANPALMRAIEGHATPVVKCSRIAIGTYAANRGEAGLKTPAETLSAAIADAARQCVSKSEIGEVSALIRSTMPDVSTSSADAVAQSMLSQYAAMSVMSDSD